MNRRPQPLRAAAVLLGLVLVAGLLSVASPGAKAASALPLTWTQQLPDTSPSGIDTSTSVMAYFPPTREVVLLGRVNVPGVGFQSVMWTWDGVTWARRHIDDPESLPPSREQAAMTYDSEREQLVMFGGYDEDILAETWTYGLDAVSGSFSWSDATPELPGASPPPRSMATMTYDADRKQVVLFGGSGSATWLGDTWTWDGSTWTPRAVTGPEPRGAAEMVFDAARSNVVLFGGLVQNYGDTHPPAIDARDTWTWDGVAWTLVIPDAHGQVPIPGEASPPARHRFGFAYHQGMERAVLFGGQIGGLYSTGTLNDTWLWDGASWSELTPQTPLPLTPTIPPRPGPTPAPLMVNAVSAGALVMFDGLETWNFGAPPLSLTPASIPADPAFASEALATVTDLAGNVNGSATVTFTRGDEPPVQGHNRGDGTYAVVFNALGTPGKQRVTAATNTGLVSSSALLEEVVNDLPSVASLAPNYGWTHGGTQVEIRGRHLSVATSVQFGGVSAAFRVDSPTQLTATSPVHDMGVVNVTITGPGGTTGPSPGSRFNYYAGSTTPTGSLNGARLDHTATVLGDGRVLVVGGRHSSTARDEAMASVELYDANTGEWSLMNPLSTARRDHTATLLDPPRCQDNTAPVGYPCGQVLVAGGLGSTVAGSPNPPVLASAEIYDPAGDAWTPVPPLTSCTLSSSDCAARSSHTATLLRDGRVLLAGGGDSLASAQIFEPITRSWSAAAPLDAGRRSHTAALIGSKVLVAGGRSAPDDGDLPRLPPPLPDDDIRAADMDSAELYDPSADSWAPTASLAHASGEGARATVLKNGEVLIAGGCYCSMGEVYRPGTGTWSATRTMEFGRRGDSASLADGRVALFGGPATAPRNAVVLYDPATNAWIEDYHLTVARGGHTASLLANGKVLVAGGADESGRARHEAELYDPSVPQDLLGATVSNVEPRSGPTAGGTRVAIRGSNFALPLSVKFGDVAAGVVEIISENELVAASPAQAQGEVPVVVARPGFSASPAVAVGTFTYGSGTWEPTATMDDCGGCGDPRFNHTATRLADGGVLVAGGTEDYYLWAAIRTAYLDGESTVGSNIYSKVSPDFVASDAGRILKGENLPDDDGATILDVIDARTVRLSALATATGRDLAFYITHTCQYPQAEGIACTNDRPNPDASLSSALLYDPRAGSWTPTGSMRVGRQSHTSTVLSDGRVLVAGGIDALGNAMASAEIFNPTSRTWTATPDMNVARLSHTTTLLADGRVLAVGGALSEAGRSRALSSAEIYDPAANRWTSTPALPSGHVNHTAVLLAGPGCGPRCGQVLVAGGMAAGEGATKANASAKVDLFDPATFTWSAQPEMTVGRLSHGSVQLPGGKILVAGGFVADGVTTNSVELYDPARGTWAPTGSMRRPDANGSAVLLNDGTVLVAGGGATYPVGITTNSAITQVYEPSTGRWSFTSPLAHPRAGHTLTLLDTGSVLVAGGYGSASSSGPPYTFPATDELYVPAPTLNGVTPPAGPLAGGTVATITGSALGGVSSLGFGDINVATTPCPPAPTAACFTVDSPTRITAVTPPHVKGRVPIFADGPGGTSRRLSTAPAGGLVARFAYLEEPGAVGLAAEATSPTDVRLTLRAPDDGGGEPATIYVLKQSLAPILTQEDFDAATALALGAFVPTAVGEELVVDVSDLAPATTYHYSVQAVNLAGLRGPRSDSVSAETPAAAAARGSCPAVPDVAGAIRYPSGYSLLGLPAGTALATVGPLYSWFDQGAGGTYATSTPGSLDAGRGYWAWSPCPHLAQLSGPGVATAGFALGAYRASMVGNPSGSAPATVTGHDFAAAWDPGLNAGAGGYHISGYREPQTLAVGAGTWLFSFVRTEVRIQAPS